MDKAELTAREKNEGRVRLLRLLQLLETDSDAEHPISTPECIRLLKERWDIDAFRITIGRDMEALAMAGYDVQTIHSTQNKYYLGTRTFEQAELKLLIDAVASSKFITAAKSKVLTDKLAAMANVHQAGDLKRNISLTERIKPKNEHIYEYIDVINRAINEKQKISFLYFTWTAAKRKCPKNDGKPYIFSPYTLTWNGDCYYMVGWSDKHEKVATFRVDRISKTPKLLEKDAVKKPKGWSIADFSEKAFQLFDGERTTVELLCHEDAMNSVIDHFGEQAKTKPVDDTHFLLTAEVSLSPTFFAWIFQFGGKIKIKGPEEAIIRYQQLLCTVKNSINSDLANGEIITNDLFAGGGSSMDQITNNASLGSILPLPEGCNQNNLSAPEKNDKTGYLMEEQLTDIVGYLVRSDRAKQAYQVAKPILRHSGKTILEKMDQADDDELAQCEHQAKICGIVWVDRSWCRNAVPYSTKEKCLVYNAENPNAIRSSKSEEQMATEMATIWAEFKIEELGLSIHAYNCLHRAGVCTVSALLEKSRKDLFRIRNVGRRVTDEIEALLAEFGLTLKEEGK